MEGIRQGDIPGVQLRRRQLVLGMTPAGLWPHLAEPVKLSQWLADRVRSEPGPPVVFRLETDQPNDSAREEYAEVVEWSPPRRMVLGFRELHADWRSATSLTLELHPVAQGCEVMVFQEGFQQLPLSLGLTVWERSRLRWTAALGRLAQLAELAS